MWRTPDRVEMAEGPGFEPGLTGPEPVVLPLDDPSVFGNHPYYKKFFNGSRAFWASAFPIKVNQIFKFCSSAILNFLASQLLYS